MDFYLRTATMTPKLESSGADALSAFRYQEHGHRVDAHHDLLSPMAAGAADGHARSLLQRPDGLEHRDRDQRCGCAELRYDKQFEHDLRYDMADEYMDLVQQLWESWDADAVVMDRASGTFIDPSKVRRVNFEGKYYKSNGLLNVPRSPQTRLYTWRRAVRPAAGNSAS